MTDCAFDSDNGEVNSFLNREGVSFETYKGSYRYVSNYKYNELMSPKITFIKDDFSDFKQNEVQSVLAWLTHSSTPSFADFYDDADSNIISYSLLGGWTDIQLYKVSNCRVVGIVAAFESTTPYALSPVRTTTKIITSPQTFTINCDTDEYDELLYPKVVVTEGNSVVVQADHAMTNMSEHVGGTVYKYENTYYWVDGDSVTQSQSSIPQNWSTTSVLVENLTINSKTIVSNNIVGETITIDGANRVINSSRDRRIFGEDFNFQWLPLKRGNNSIKVTGNCTIEITYRTPMKIGEW